MKLKTKAIIYILIIVLGDILIKWGMMKLIKGMVLKNTFYDYLYTSSLSVLFWFVLAFIIESIRFFRKGKIEEESPFWFSVLESTLSIWILTTVGLLAAAFYVHGGY